MNLTYPGPVILGLPSSSSIYRKTGDSPTTPTS